MLTHEWLPATTEKAAQNERNDHDVVELPGNRDEIRY
jgi:hypothetical protein